MLAPLSFRKDEKNRPAWGHRRRYGGGVKRWTLAGVKMALPELGLGGGVYSPTHPGM